ncbi:hypothetical protein B5X24_HaOG212185 [Helicoverpa armigera]|nr:hypothetical protein B5X24_HaOG212185 [Helicoverpa armigera]
MASSKESLKQRGVLLLRARRVDPRGGHASLAAVRSWRRHVTARLTDVTIPLYFVRRALNNVESYCCERGAWIRGVATLPSPLSGHGAVTLPPASLM